jgi:spore coat protein A
VPERLAEVEPLVPAADATVRTFDLTRGPAGDHRGWTINGASFDPDGSLADVPLGEVEVCRRDGRAPGRFDGGWKDTVDLRPAERSSRWRCGSATTPGGSSCTATTASTRTWR